MTERAEVVKASSRKPRRSEGASPTSEPRRGGELTQYAKVDPALFGMPLFRPLPRRDRDEARKKRFEADIIHGGHKLKVLGLYVLGADDLSVLLAVLALAGLFGFEIDTTESERAMVEIRDGLESKGDALDAVHMRVRTSLYALCREAGIARNGQAYERIEASLERMRGIYYNDYGPVTANSRRVTASSKQNLLTFRMNEAEDEIVVVVNARFAAVLLGQQFIRVNLSESRSLGEMARLLHLRFSVVVREGRSWSVGIDRLCETLYGSEAKSQRDLRHRREKIREGIAELRKLPGWTIAENRERQVVTAERAAFKEQPATPTEGCDTTSRAP